MRSAVLVLCGALAAAAPALAQFEGVADFKVSTNSGKGEAIPATGKISVTATAYRMEMETDVSKISRGKSGRAADAPQRIKMTMFGKVAEPDKLTMIDDANKTYSVWDLKKMRGQMKDADGPTYTVIRKGTDTVAGLSCQRAELVSTAGTVIDVCVAREFAVSGDWLAALGRRQRENTSWMSALRDTGLAGFPVRYSVRQKNTAEPFVTMEVTRVVKGPVSGALFEVPAGYKETAFAMGGLSPEQQKSVSDARAKMRESLERMTPEQRKAYQDAMKRYARPTPTPAP
jgi:hypothetical protein